MKSPMACFDASKIASDLVKKKTDSFRCNKQGNCASTACKCFNKADFLLSTAMNVTMPEISCHEFKESFSAARFTEISADEFN